MQHRPRDTSETSPNKLLAAIPSADYRRLLPLLDTMPLPFKHILHEPGETLRLIYFPGGGVCSITQAMKNQRMVEVATVGNEGFIGLSALFGGDRVFSGAFVKVPDGAAQVMTVGTFRREMKREGRFSQVINGYAHVFVAFLTQSVACNALHSVEQRCARWLLTTRDRVGRNEFPLTQELLALMLGVHRPTVTLAASSLQRARLIEYERGRVVILDRAGLEGASCECYAVMKRHFARLLH
jgi:CRP-like cAMP-binding protein